MRLVKAVYAAVCGIIACCTGSVLAEAPTPTPPYLVMRQPSKVSPILGSTTSEKSLISYFGANNVKRKTVPVVEGETADGTVIYPDDPKRRVTFIWKNSKKRDIPETIYITDQPSLWRLPNEITVGTTLTELEKINGKSFKLSGFDWDYGGNVLSWNGGKLESALKSKSGKVSATVQLVPPKGKNTPDGLSGDRELQSSNAAMQKFNPVVGTVSILAP